MLGMAQSKGTELAEEQSYPRGQSYPRDRATHGVQSYLRGPELPKGSRATQGVQSKGTELPQGQSYQELTVRFMLPQMMVSLAAPQTALKGTTQRPVLL